MCNTPFVTGTFAFSAPEYQNSVKYDAKSEVWSLGLILYEILFNDLREKIQFQEQLCQFLSQGFKYLDKKDIREDVFDLLNRSIVPNAQARMSPQELFDHPFVAFAPENRQ